MYEHIYGVRINGLFQTYYGSIVVCNVYIAEKKTKWNKLPYALRQVVTGIVFGIIACLATEFEIATDDVVLNVRNAAPLTAGLLFGGPAGIISGVVGGVYRYVSVIWGVWAYSWSKKVIRYRVLL